MLAEIIHAQVRRFYERKMRGQLDRVAEAFSRKATVYDAFGEGHENLARMRRRVYAHLEAQIPPGSRMLELNAGTGLDAVELVQRSYRVHATDLSPGMVAEIEKKIHLHGLEGKLSAQQCSFTELEKIYDGPFDAIFSNFGGLNCIADLGAVTRGLPRLLKPGGTVTCVIMPRICPWELIRLAKDWRTATRRLRPSGVLANVEGIHFQTYYYSARQVRLAFGKSFRRLHQEGLAVVTPGADNHTFATSHPGWYRFLAWAETALAAVPPFSGWGDFFILTMQYAEALPGCGP